MMNLGDFLEDTTNIGFTFTSRSSAGTPTALSSGDIDVYKISSTIPTTAGVTLTSTFNNVVGLNRVQIDASSTTFYATAEEYSVVLSQGEIGSIDVAGETLAHFSIENRGSTQKVIDALTAYGVTTAASTHTSTDVFEQSKNALSTYGVTTVASTHTTTDVFEQAKNAFSTLGYTAVLATDLSSAVTVTTTDLFDEAKNALSTYGVTTAASTHTSTDVFEQAKNALSSYGVTTAASTHTSTDVFEQAKNAISTLGVSTHTSTNIFDQSKNALSTVGVSTHVPADVMTAAMTQSYTTAANPTPAQALFGIHQMMMNFAINSTVLTVYQIGTTVTEAMKFELNSSTAPTAIKRTS